MTLALTHLGYRVVSGRDHVHRGDAGPGGTRQATAATGARRVRETYSLSFGFTRGKTLKGWGLQTLSVVGVLASMAYIGTLLASPWLGFHPHLIFASITVVYAVERLVTVRSRGWKVALGSATVVVEWGSTSTCRSSRCGRCGAWCGAPRRPGDIRATAPDQERKKKRRKTMYDKVVGAALPTTGLAAHFAGGLNYLYAALIAFAVVGVFSRSSGCLPKRHDTA